MKNYLEELSCNVEFQEQLARDAAVSQLCGLRKPVDAIIQEKQTFFNSLTDIDVVHIYGFSFSPIDEPYIKIIASKFKSAEWEISDYKNGNCHKIKDFLYRHDVNNFKIINLEDILDKRQLKFDF